MFTFGKTCVAVSAFHAQNIKKFPEDSLADCCTFPLRVQLTELKVYLHEGNLDFVCSCGFL